MTKQPKKTYKHIKKEFFDNVKTSTSATIEERPPIMEILSSLFINQWFFILSICVFFVIVTHFSTVSNELKITWNFLLFISSILCLKFWDDSLEEDAE